MASATTEAGRAPRRVVALGASNLTRGFQPLVATARERWGRDVEVLVALGHGRSYGAASRIAVRTLPGILQSGLWRELGARPAVPTRALVTDVGNDILYGSSADQTLEWVEECLDRLAQLTPDVILTDLPLASIRRLSRAKFLVFRSVIVPSCRLSLAQITETAEQVSEGLAALAARRGLRFVGLRPEWYGVDPIHIRPRFWQQAWREILCGDEPADAPRGPRSFAEALRLYALPPERRWLFGREQVHPQSGRMLRDGGRVWLY